MNVGSLTVPVKARGGPNGSTIPRRHPGGPRLSRRNPYVYISGVFAGAWVVAAWVRPDADYVVFPILVAGSFPVSYRLALGPLPVPPAIGSAVAGAITAFVAALVMHITGVLAPATVLPAVGDVGQALTLGLLGGTLGAVLATWRPG